MFTANPLTGLRNETVIDATFGLGEALVSGQVEPDPYVVDVYRNAIVSKTLGAKQVATRSRAGGGVETSREDASTRQALSDAQILNLADQGRSIQRAYGFPQDIEWAFFEDKCYILQSRAITSLFPVPEETYDPLLVWFSFGAMQGLVGPITPIGQDGIRQVFAGDARLFDVKLAPADVHYFQMAGERYYLSMGARLDIQPFDGPSSGASVSGRSGCMSSFVVNPCRLY